MKGGDEMVKVETSVVINRPIGEVFEFVVNPESGPQWESWLLEARKTSRGPMGVGATWQEVRQFLGRRIESTNEVTEYEPNKRFWFKSASGPFPVEGGYTFEPIEGGTRVTVTGQGDTGGFFKLADPIVARMVKRQIEADSANLKEFLEAQA
jgi:uncharacterized membrane protein